MFPKQFADHPTGSFKVPVAIPGFLPLEGDLVQVCLNKAWIPYVLGAFQQLLLASTWKYNTDEELASVQGDVFDLMSAFGTAIDNPCVDLKTPTGGSEGGENLIRQNPSNPCELQTSIDGTNWCTFADLSLCFNTLTSQPGAGSPQPAPGGGCTSYDAKMSARDQWLVPTTVNTGDTISFASITGAGSDGTLHWYCQDGSVFFAGVCAGQRTPQSGDPAPTVPHMTLLAVIGSNKYDITAGPITVPAGVSNGQCYIQVNDSNLADNSGDYKFTVTVCNNQAATWSHTLNFALSPSGGTAFSGKGSWVAGTGWTPSNTGGGQLRVQIPFSTTFTLTEIDLKYSVTNAIVGAVGVQAYSDLFSTLIHYYQGSVADHGTATNQVDVDVFTSNNVKALQLVMDTYNSPPTGAFIQLVLRGTGVQPTWP